MDGVNCALSNGIECGMCVLGTRMNGGRKFKGNSGTGCLRLPPQSMRMAGRSRVG